MHVGHHSAEPSAGSFEHAVEEFEQRGGSEAAQNDSEESGPLQGVEEGLQSGAAGEVFAAGRYEMPGFLALIGAEAWQEFVYLGIGEWQEGKLVFRVEFGDKTCRGATEPSPVCVDEDGTWQ